MPESPLAAAPATSSLWRDAGRRLARNPAFAAATLAVALLVVMAAAPQLFTGTDPRACDLADSRAGPRAGAPFGFDVQGCDYYARTVYGARASVAIGLLAAAGAGLVGVAAGTLAGYAGRWVDALVSRTADVMVAIPTVLGALLVLTAFDGSGIVRVALVFILLAWPLFMRLTRGQVIAVRGLDYVRAARVLGAGHGHVVRRHVLPNALAPVVAYGAVVVGVLIGAEATLSYLGAGLQLPAISWGLQLAAAEPYVAQSPHLIAFPGGFLAVTVLSFLVMGDQLRDALDPGRA